MVVIAQNWFQVITLSLFVIAVIVIWSFYFNRFTYNYINDVEDLSTHHDKYRLYFWILGVCLALSEAIFELHKIRSESELIFYFSLGIFCIFIAILSVFVSLIKYNIHKIFVWFYIIITILILHKVYLEPTNTLSIVDFTMFMLLSYYAFFDFKHFYFYLIGVFLVLLVFFLFGVFDIKYFTIYANGCLISYIINFGRNIVEINIHKNLLFVYNFVNKSSTVILGVNKSGEIKFISKNLKSIVGLDRHHWIGKNWQNIVLDKSETETLDKEQIYLHKINNKLIEWRNIKPLYKGLAIKVGTDVSESRQAQIALKQSEERFRFISENSSDAIAIFENDKVIYISPAHIKLFGYSEEETYNQSLKYILTFIHHEDQKRIEKIYLQTIVSRVKSVKFEYRFLHKNGTYIWREDSLGIVYDEAGNPIKSIFLVREINDRKEAELAQQHRHEKQIIQNKILTNLSMTPFEEFGVYAEYLKTITKKTAEGLDINRVSVWTYDDCKIICQDLFESLKNHHSKGNIFDLRNFPNYFNSISSGLAIVANDVYTNEQTMELSESYLKPLNIKSMLDVPIRVGGVLEGIICCEQLNEAKEWTDEDVAFARSVADIVSLSIEARRRKKAEAKLLENQQQLIYKSNILAAITKTAEQLLVSKNIYKTLTSTFELIGKAANVDRVFFFENDLNTNIIDQKVEWTRDTIVPQINNPATHNLSFDEIYFYSNLLQNQIYQETISTITDPKLKDRWAKQNILAVILFPIFIKDVFQGFVGFDDCTTEQKWSSDQINVLQSFATNIANAIERLRNEAIIAESENNFRQINDTIDDVFFLYDVIREQHIYISSSCKKVLGVEQEYFYQKDSYIKDYLFEEDQSIDERIRKQIHEHNTAEFEYRVKTNDGQIKWIYEKNFGIRNDKGELIKISGICTDITEKKLSQTQIKQLSLVAEKITNGVLITDPLGHVLWANQSLLDMMEIAPEQLLGKRPRDLFNPKTKEFSENYTKMDALNYIVEVEVLTYKKNKKWIQINNTAIKDESGNNIQQIEVIIDITERKKSEQEIKESQQKLTSILNALDEVVWAVSLDSLKLLFVSQSFEKIYGKTIDELNKNMRIWKKLIHQKDKDVPKQIAIGVKNAGIGYGVFRIIDTNGNIKWLDNTVKVVKNINNEPLMIMGITTDITEKKTAEEALIKAQEETNTANKAKSELELRALQMQMNPHFVFNALNSIQSYVMSHDTLTANNYLTKFAHLIRLFLDSSRSRFIALGEEVRLLKLYMELEKLRFEDKFDFEIVVDYNVSKYFEMPTMILQPFVENAINHGLRYKKTKGLLSIKFYSEAASIICKIEDNGVGRKNVGKIQSKSSKGYQSQGLKITAERLHTYNKINEANIVFSISDKIIDSKNPNEEVGTVVEIRFPTN